MQLLDSVIILLTLGQEHRLGLPANSISSVMDTARVVSLLAMKRTIFGFKFIAYHDDTAVFITKHKEYGYRIETFSRRSTSGSTTLLSRDGDAREEPIKDMQEVDLVRCLFGNLESLMIIRRGLDNDAS